MDEHGDPDRGTDKRHQPAPGMGFNMRGGSNTNQHVFQKFDQNQDYVNADDEGIEPEQENSQEFEQPRIDPIEGTKNFNKAYDKLIKKFYHEEGANLLIP